MPGGSGSRGLLPVFAGTVHASVGAALGSRGMLSPAAADAAADTPESHRSWTGREGIGTPGGSGSTGLALDPVGAVPASVDVALGSRGLLPMGGLPHSHLLVRWLGWVHGGAAPSMRGRRPLLSVRRAATWPVAGRAHR